MAEPKKLDPEAALAAKIAELDAKLEALGELETELTAKMRSGGGGITEDALTRIVSAASKSSDALAQKLIPENKIHPQKGPFEYPEGGLVKTKPRLSRDVSFNGQRQDHRRLTPGEILAANSLSDSLARGQKRTSHDGRWIASVSDDNATLSLTLPIKTMDDRMDLPGFAQILMELTGGERVLDTNEMAQQLALLQQRIAQLEGAAV